jgi:serine/threonine-protein kinase
MTAETISSDDKLFGQIVVKNRLASRDDVSRVLTNLVDMQRGGVSTVSLGELFIMEGLLTQKQVEAVEDLRRMLVRSRAIKQVGGYELKKKIGEGGMGQVYAAYQPALDRKVAIKILPRELVDDPSMVRRFQREAKAAAELNHENVIPVYDFGRMGEEYYLVMEYVEGRNLEEILDRQGDIRPDIALKITKQVARALQHAHSHGITHRDMKPNNIMITKEGKAKLADLGLAKRLDGNSGNITQTGVIVGTPAFMAPEQITNPKGVDLRTDIYGLGVTLYCMITGGTPFETRTTMEVVHDLVAGKSAIPEEIRGCHPAVAQLIHKMTAANPDDRHPSADEVLIDIKRAERSLKNKNPDVDSDATGADDGDGKYNAPFENPETMDSSQMIQVLMPDPGPNPWLLWGGVGLGVAALIGVLWLLLG